MFNPRYPLLVLALTAGLNACSEQSSSTETASTQTPSASPTMAENTTISNTVAIQAGTIIGEMITANGATARIFRGVPYAAAPVGDLRWKAPQPVQAWEGVRGATTWGDRCPQGASSMGAENPISEDCLNLNVTTAAATSNDKLPVMVFYHGGGLTTGTGNSTTYTHPALTAKGIVLVSVNSRLGPMGYLAHPALSKESAHNESGNYGTLDITASLVWVQENIAAFGGDPDNVTIFGESGGGSKTISQMASSMTEDLFHKAIVESGAMLVSAEAVTTLADAETRGQKLVAALGIEESDTVLADMRAASWEDVIKAGSNREVGFRANVVVDGHIIPDSINTLFLEGKQRDVPLIVGANEGESMLKASVPLMANLHSASASSPTYVYNFSQLPKSWREEEGCVAFHGLELAYVFGNIPEGVAAPTMTFLARGGGCSASIPTTDEQDQLAASNSVSLWAQFAKTGNPSIEGLIEWPQYTETNNRYLDIAATLEAKEGIESAFVAPPAN